MPECGVIGWDIGGAHVKAARREGGRVITEILETDEVRGEGA